MTVTATKLVNRDIYSIEYQKGDGALGMKATLTNPENGDVSETGGYDDGKFQVTVATGYSGRAEVKIEDLNGHELDSGVVYFGDATEDDFPHPEQLPEEPAEA